MTTGSTPKTGARPRPARPGGSSLQANLPYLAMIVVSLVVLVTFIALAHPFSPVEEGAGTTVATTAAAATTTLGVDATSTTVAGATTSSTSAASGAVHGEEIFNSTCIACHGVGGVGVEGLGKDLTTSAFVAELTDDELLAFLIAGRSDTDPLNTTGMEMPARGGNPSLTDADLRDVIAYLRTLQG
jgi:disulfide bond formation protein DsbB